MVTLEGEILGLDLGTVRTGVARIHTIAKIAEPLQHIQMDDDFVENVKKLTANYHAVAIVVGMPRGLDGQTTEQTRWAQSVFEALQHALPVPVFAIDEAGTTAQAHARKTSGESIDSAAASIFLEDFVMEAARGGIENVRV